MTSLELPHRARDDQGLAAGILVTTPDGEKKIEDVVAGDMVLSGVGGYKTDFYEVKKTSAKPYCGPMLRITAGRSNHQFRATPNHICFGIQFRDGLADHVEPTEDSILLWAFEGNGTDHVAHRIIKESDVGDIDQPVAEYFNNLDDAEAAARQMAQAIGGVGVERLAYFVPYQCFSFMPAEKLTIASKIPTVLKDRSVARASITNITEEHYDGLVYDLDIPESRNFAANGVLVHDSRA